ncbi:MAG: acetylornithine deacetylase [Bacteroidetes bacterium]|nr:MAG: acetylornithine deacetylase [Bacteroidota bacterium]
MKKAVIVIFAFIFNFSFAQKIDKINHNGSSISIEYLLQNYLQILSVSGNEKEAGDFIKNICKENGLHISDFGKENGNYNFAASIFPLSSKKPNIIFLNHIDVVPELENSARTLDLGSIDKGIIYGRGAIDNKGAAMMQLYSIIQFLHNGDLKNSKYNITFLSVSCEETQCAGGVQFVIDNYLDLLNPAVVIGEGPSEITTLIGGDFKHPIFGISVAHKRSFWLKLELESNNNAHGSITPLNYSNKELVVSLSKLTKKKNKVIFNDLNIGFLKALAEHKKGMEKMILKHPKLFKPVFIPQLRKEPELFALFSNTITLTNLYTNSNAYNEIASKTGAYLDCRLLPNTDENEFLEMIRKRLDNDDIKITIINQMPTTKHSQVDNLFYKNLSSSISKKFPSATTLPLMMPNYNDLGAFRALNIPAYASIPVYLTREQVESIHGEDEHIPIKALYTGAEVYYNFLVKMESEHTSDSQ